VNCGIFNEFEKLGRGNIMRFSERMGYKEVKSLIQIDSVDEDIINGLWNGIKEFYYDYYFDTSKRAVNHYSLKNLTKKIWNDFYKEPMDIIDLGSNRFINEIREEFFYPEEWYEVYDFIEFIAQNFENDKVNKEFMEYCNKIMEREVSAYRFVGGQIAQITNYEEIQEIEDAITNPLTSELVKKHFSNSLKLLTDKKSPDYRNSIKESISAVECLAKKIIGNPNTTLGAALNEIEKKGTIEFHNDLKEGLKKIYHYTSDAAGIRHALKDSSNVEFDDAKFMLVSCTAFCNYLTSKADKAGISVT